MSLQTTAEYFRENLLKEIKFENNIQQTSVETQLTLPEDFLLLAEHLSTIDPDVKMCIKYMYSRGLKERDLWFYKLGTSKRGRYRRRVIIPSFDAAGNLNYFVARGIDSDVKFKYLNPHVNKNDIIFNEFNIDWSKELTITEGPLDLVKCNVNSTCILGSSLSKNLSYLTRLYHTNPQCF